MYNIKEAIVVEGTYDKIKLARFIDGVIITTGGFTVYRVGAIIDTIKKFAQTTGVVILTDSDSAGFKIRNYIKQAVTDGNVLHAYVPDIHGKEKRKKTAGKEGLIGVEGMDEGVILDALKKAGCTIDGNSQQAKRSRKITKTDLFMAGLAGGANSKELRQKLAQELEIPMKISANMLIDVLNRLLDYDEFIELLDKIH